MDRHRGGQVDTGWAGLQETDVQNAIAALTAMKAYKSRGETAMTMLPGDSRQNVSGHNLLGVHEERRPQSQSSMNSDMLRFADLGRIGMTQSSSDLRTSSNGNDMMSSMMKSHSMSHIEQNSGYGSIADLMMRPPFPVPRSENSVESLQTNTLGMYSIPKVTDDLFKTPTQGTYGQITYNPAVSLSQQDFQQQHQQQQHQQQQQQQQQHRQQQQLHQPVLDLSGSFDIPQHVSLPMTKHNDFTKNYPFLQKDSIPNSKFEPNVSRNSIFLHSDHQLKARQENDVSKDFSFLQNGPTSESLSYTGQSAIHGYPLGMAGDSRVSQQSAVSPFPGRSPSRGAMPMERSENIHQKTQDTLSRSAQQSNRQLHLQGQAHDMFRKDLQTQSSSINKDGSQYQKYVEPVLNNALHHEQNACTKEQPPPQGFNLPCSSSVFSQSMTESNQMPSFSSFFGTSPLPTNVTASNEKSDPWASRPPDGLKDCWQNMPRSVSSSPHASNAFHYTQNFQKDTNVLTGSGRMTPQEGCLLNQPYPDPSNSANQMTPQQEQMLNRPHSEPSQSANKMNAQDGRQLNRPYPNLSNSANKMNRQEEQTLNRSHPDLHRSANKMASQGEQMMNQLYPDFHRGANKMAQQGERMLNQPYPQSANNRQQDLNHAAKLPNASFNMSSQSEKREMSPKYPFQSSPFYSESGSPYTPSSHQLSGGTVTSQQSLMTPVSSNMGSISSSSQQQFKLQSYKDPMMDQRTNMHNPAYSNPDHTFKIPPTPPYQQKQHLSEKISSKNTHRDEKSKLNNMPSAQGKISIAKPKAIKGNPRKKKAVSPQSPHLPPGFNSPLFPPFSTKSEIARNKPKIGPGSEKKISDLMESEVDRKLLAMFPQYQFYLDQNVKPMEEIMPIPGEEAIMKKIHKAKNVTILGDKKKRKVKKKDTDVLSNIKTEMSSDSGNALGNGIHQDSGMGNRNKSIPLSIDDLPNNGISIDSEQSKCEITDKPGNNCSSSEVGKCDVSSGSTENKQSNNQKLDSDAKESISDISVSSSSTDEAAAVLDAKVEEGVKPSKMCCSECADVGIMYSKQCQNKVNLKMGDSAACPSKTPVSEYSSNMLPELNMSSHVSSSLPSTSAHSVSLDNSLTVSSTSQNMVLVSSEDTVSSRALGKGSQNDLDLKRTKEQSSGDIISEGAIHNDQKISDQGGVCENRSVSADSVEKGLQNSANGLFNKIVKTECIDPKCESTVKCENSENQEKGQSPWDDMPLNNLQATIQKLFERVYNDKTDEMDLISKIEQGHGNVEISPQKMASNKTQNCKHITPPSSPMNKHHVENNIKMSPSSGQQTPGSTPEKSKVHFDIDGLWTESRQVPFGLLDLDDHLRNNRIEVPCCNCLGPGVTPDERDGPYYTQLGSARNLPAVRAMLEARTGMKGSAIRIEKARYTGKEGKTSLGCPMAKWIIRRSSYDEKYLCVVKERRGHFCENTVQIIVLVAWEGVPSEEADGLYSLISTIVTKDGNETERRCGTNERRTCACQGIDLIRRGASFSFGCSWSMYFNGCKFARSRNVRKFKLKDTSKEETLEGHLQNLASHVGPLYKKVAPDGHRNQCQFSETGQECRLGNNPPKEKPFSGVTACVDFCAHSHKDLHNINNGSTVVVTLSKNRGLRKPDDEQLHVLPLYVLDPTDEFGSAEGQMEKVRSGALEMLTNFPFQARIRSKPLTPCKKRAKLNKSLQSKIVRTISKGKSGHPPKMQSLQIPKNGPQMPNAAGQMPNAAGLMPNAAGLMPNVAGQMPNVAGLMPNAAGQMPNVAGQMPNAAGLMPNAAGQMPNAAGQKPNVAGQMPNVAGQMPNAAGQMPNAAGQMPNSNAEQMKKNNLGDMKEMMNDPSAAKRGSFEQLISLSGLPNYQDLYEKFWDYFYSNGSFPAETFLSKWAEARGGQVISSTNNQNKGTESSAGQNAHVPPSPHSISQLSSQEQANKAGPPAAGFNQAQSTGSGLEMSNSGGQHNQCSGNGDPPMKKQCLMPKAGEHPIDLTNDCENSRQQPPGGTADNGQHIYYPHPPAEHSRSQEGRPLSAVPFSSPLDMLCEAAMRSDPPRPQSQPPSLSSVPYQSHNPSLPGDRSQLTQAANRLTPSQHPMQENALPLPINNLNSHSNSSANAKGLSTNMCSDNLFCDPNKQVMYNVNQQPAMFQNGMQQQLSFQNGGIEENKAAVNASGNCSSSDECYIDPTVVRCEMDYNESNFRDPEIGGVAIALGHGAVLFEVAKRELHATTALRSPNRYHPTRISLVFYQHKNLNYANHGWSEHEKKMELLHEKRLRAAVDKGMDVEDIKPGKRKKKKVEETPKIDFSKTSAAQYKYMWDAPVRHGLSFTTDSIITRWIDPQPMVSGPYQRWV